MEPHNQCTVPLDFSALHSRAVQQTHPSVLFELRQVLFDNPADGNPESQELFLVAFGVFAHYVQGCQQRIKGRKPSSSPLQEDLLPVASGL